MCDFILTRTWISGWKTSRPLVSVNLLNQGQATTERSPLLGAFEPDTPAR